MEFIQQYLPQLQHLGDAGYLLLFAVTFAESFVLAGMFVPGTVLLVIMGGLVPYGYYTYRELALFAVLGAIIGQSVSYELGRMGKVHAEKFSFIKGSIDRCKRLFHKHKGKGVFISRFIGPIRPIAPFVAGMIDMKRSHFYAMNLASALVWSVFYLGMGYIFGYAWKSALVWSSAGIAGVIVLFVLGYAGVSLWRWYWAPKRDKKLGL